MPTYEDSVFLNVPFDSKYKRIFDALVFAVHDCGFSARSALEIEDSGEARVDKILNIIEQSKFGIHDISRAGVDSVTRLARFNMPLELGFFLGAKRYGSKRHFQKRCLILDRESYRYRNFCSDISGQDIRAHAVTRQVSRCPAAKPGSRGTRDFELKCQIRRVMFASITQN